MYCLCTVLCEQMEIEPGERGDICWYTVVEVMTHRLAISEIGVDTQEASGQGVITRGRG